MSVPTNDAEIELPPTGTEEWRRAIIESVHHKRLDDDFHKLAEEADD